MPFRQSIQQDLRGPSRLSIGAAIILELFIYISQGTVFLSCFWSRNRERRTLENTGVWDLGIKISHGTNIFTVYIKAKWQTRIRKSTRYVLLCWLCGSNSRPLTTYTALQWIPHNVGEISLISFNRHTWDRSMECMASCIEISCSNLGMRTTMLMCSLWLANSRSYYPRRQ